MTAASVLVLVSRQYFHCLGLGLGLEGHCLGLGLGLEGQCLGLGLGLGTYCLGPITGFTSQNKNYDNCDKIIIR